MSSRTRFASGTIRCCHETAGGFTRVVPREVAVPAIEGQAWRRAGRVAVDKPGRGEIVADAVTATAMPLRVWPVIIAIFGIVMLFL